MTRDGERVCSHRLGHRVRSAVRCDIISKAYCKHHSFVCAVLKSLHSHHTGIPAVQSQLLQVTMQGCRDEDLRFVGCHRGGARSLGWRSETPQAFEGGSITELVVGSDLYIQRGFPQVRGAQLAGRLQDRDMANVAVTTFQACPYSPSTALLVFSLRLSTNLPHPGRLYTHSPTRCIYTTNTLA